MSEIKGIITKLEITPDARYITIRTDYTVDLPMTTDVILTEDKKPWEKRTAPIEPPA